MVDHSLVLRHLAAVMKVATHAQLGSDVTQELPRVVSVARAQLIGAQEIGASESLQVFKAQLRFLADPQVSSQEVHRMVLLAAAGLLDH